MIMAARIVTLVAFPAMVLLPFWFPDPWLIALVVLWLAIAAYGWAR